MVRIAAVLLCLCVSGSASAQIYKCMERGKVTYSEAPCPGAQVTRLDVQAAPAPETVPAKGGDDLARQKKLADQMATARQAREAKDERERDKFRRAAAARFQKCEKLRLRKKWADEDAAGARDSNDERSLRRKASRAAESLKVECPG